MASKDRCDRYKLLDPNLPMLSTAESDRVAVINQNRYGDQNQSAAAKELSHLHDRVEELEIELLETKDRYHDMEVELFETLQSGDKTPAALLFFAAMHDPAYIQSLQQVVLQMKELRGFVDGTMHIDFITMKKRLQVAVACTPSIEKLIYYYSTLYKKWSTARANWFAQKNLVGGSAESFNYCALCYHDTSIIEDRSGSATAASAKRSVTEKQKKLKGKQPSQLSKSTNNLPPIGY
jgi:hypothetical protein